MSELIDREAAIRKIEPWLYSEGRGESELNILRAVIAELKSLPAAPRWVRCEEELPKSGTHVLVCCEVRGIGGHKSRYVCDGFHTDSKSIPCRYDDDIDSEYDEETDEYYFPEGWWEVIKNWDDYSCVAISDFVTHWMPLPEPPKEVQE